MLDQTYSMLNSLIIYTIETGLLTRYEFNLLAQMTTHPVALFFSFVALASLITASSGIHADSCQYSARWLHSARRCQTISSSSDVRSLIHLTSR